MVDDDLRQKLLESEVYCSNKDSGCVWVGELGKLDEHLNLNPPPDKYLEGCYHIEIHCPHCPEIVELFRKDMIVHWNKLHCSIESVASDKVATQEDAKIKEELSADIIKKQDETKEQLKFELQETFKSKFDKFERRQAEIEKQLQDMELKEIQKKINMHKHFILKKGQDSEKQTKELDERHKRELEERLLDFEKSLELQSLHKQIEMLQEELRMQTEKLKELSQQLLENKDSQLHVDKQKVSAPSVSQPIGPVILEMPDYYERHRKSGDEWYSSAFYTHAQGYKMCLSVCANGHGNGQGTHISVYLYLMKGEFDAHLKWPFQGRITIKLINQDNDMGHYIKTIRVDDVSAATQRTMDRERNSAGFGAEKFLSHNEIKQYRYARRDSLRFEIARVVIDEV